MFEIWARQSRSTLSITSAMIGTPYRTTVCTSFDRSASCALLVRLIVVAVLFVLLELLLLAAIRLAFRLVHFESTGLLFVLFNCV